MVDAILEMSEYNRFSKGIFEWVGFRTKWMEFENVERSAGETKWSLRKLFSIRWKGLQGFRLPRFPWRPLSEFCSVSFLFDNCVYYCAHDRVGDPVAGWPSLVCIILW